MKYFPTAGVLKRIQQSASVSLFLDFDGTLVDLASIPSAIRIQKTVPVLLKRLSQKKGYTVGVISGRSLEDLKKYLPISKKILYAGNHGLEWIISGKTYVVDFPKGYISSLAKLYKLLKKLAQERGGLDVEWKKTSISVHIRNRTPKHMMENRAHIHHIIADTNSGRHFAVISGRTDVDVRPNIQWTKASVIHHFLKLKRIDMQRTTVVYIGDDTTDEDVFRALLRSVTVRVGRSKYSSAKYYLKNVNEVLKTLQSLL